MKPLTMPTKMSRAKTRVAVGIARLMSYLPPERIQRAVRWICTGASYAAPGHAKTAREAICAISKRCAGQGCVQRSIAVVILCRFDGFAPDWRTGFGIEPFTAHAWVEVDTLPIGEPEAVANYFVAHAVDVAR